MTLSVPSTRRRSFFLRLIPLLAWMALIFMLSGQQGNVSSSLSGTLTLFIAQSISRLACLLGCDTEFFQAGNLLSLLHPFVRKAAHAAEYAVLAVLLVRWLDTWLGKNARTLLTALAIAILYAAADEIHQLFVSERAGQLTDVAIDSLGAALGLLCYACRPLAFSCRDRHNLSADMPAAPAEKCDAGMLDDIFYSKD